MVGVLGLGALGVGGFLLCMNAAKSEQSGLISMGRDKLVRQTYTPGC